MTFTTPCQSLHLRDINDCWSLLTQYSAVKCTWIQQTDTPFRYSKDKAAIYDACVCIPAACVNRNSVAVSSSLFSMATARSTTPTHARHWYPRAGFPLRAEQILPVTVVGRLCVTASVLLAFHNRLQLLEHLPSPSALTASPHLKESLPATAWQNTDSLEHVNVYCLYSVRLEMTSCHKHISDFMSISSICLLECIVCVCLSRSCICFLSVFIYISCIFLSVY